MKVKEFVHRFTTVNTTTICEENTVPMYFWVELVGKPMPDGKANVCKGYYNDSPDMYDDAKVSSWSICKGGYGDHDMNVKIVAFNY